MSSEPNHTMDRWLKAFAAKRRREAGTPLELHPATRRMLHAEAARQGATRPRRTAGQGLSILWWLPRLAGAAVILLGFGMVGWVLFGPEPLRVESDLAKSLPMPPALPAASPSVSAAPTLTEPLAPAAVAPVVALEGGGAPTVAEATLLPATPQLENTPVTQPADKRVDELFAFKESTALTLAAPNEARGNRSASTDAAAPVLLATAPPPPATAAPLATKSASDLAVNSEAAPSQFAVVTMEEQSLAPSRRVARPASPRASGGAGAAKASTLAEEKPVRGVTVARASQESVTSASPRGRAEARPQAAFTRSTPGETTPVNGLAPSRGGRPSNALDLYFQQLPAVQAKVAGAKSEAGASGLLAAFSWQQSGRQLRVVDQDGSVYSGEWRAAALGQEAMGLRFRTVGVSQAPTQDSKDQAGRTRGAFVLTGTNQTMKQRVVLEGNLTLDEASGPPDQPDTRYKATPLTLAAPPAVAVSNSTGTAEAVLAGAVALPAAGPTWRIQARATLGDGRVLPIEAVSR